MGSYAQALSIVPTTRLGFSRPQAYGLEKPSLALGKMTPPDRGAMRFSYIAGPGRPLLINYIPAKFTFIYVDSLPGILFSDVASLL